MPLDHDMLAKGFRTIDHAADIGEVIELNGKNEIYILPKPGKHLRAVTAYAIALAKARPEAKIEYEFSTVFYPVTAKDTVIDVPPKMSLKAPKFTP
jgi:hypothetical protein